MPYLRFQNIIALVSLILGRKKKQEAPLYGPAMKPIKDYFRFEIDKEQRWYLDLPEWEGDKADLEMIYGADKMLDLIAKGDRSVYFTVKTRPFVNGTPLTLIEDNLPQGGGLYLLKAYNGVELNQKVWLCDVTTHIFRRLPKVIYFEYHKDPFSLHYLPPTMPIRLPYPY
jgi:hypothetical protein